MKPTFNEKLIAYLALLSGLSISAVAVYYSVVGLTAIFAAAAVPIIIMGTALEVSKLVATVWLKQNWTTAPKTIRAYLVAAVAILMLITSMGIFGFLSKAHSDQSLVSGEVLSKLAIYDEKIKTAKENIETDRRQLKQMDEAVDQVMARSTTEQGVDKSVAIRKAQARDRSALAKNIEANQKLIATLNDEAAPIRAEVRKVEAEVGPLKYIASFIYGKTDPTILEKSVTWVIIILIVVFDPLAVILLLASQISFQNFRERANLVPEPKKEILPESQINETMEGNSPEKESDVVSTATVTLSFPEVINEPIDDFDVSKHSYLFKVPENRHPPGVEPVKPQVFKSEIVDQRLSMEETIELEKDNIQNISTSSNTEIDNLIITPKEQIDVDRLDELVTSIEENIEKIQSNLQTNSTVTNTISQQEYIRIGRLLKEQKVVEFAEQVKLGRMTLDDVPEDLRVLVRARV